MVFAEQGIIGFILFVLLCGAIYFQGQNIYHSTKNMNLKYITLAVVLSLSSIIFHLLLNDLIETDKIGTLFFFNLAILVRLSGWVKSKDQSFEY